jgi:hypothetical protein
VVVYRNTRTGRIVHLAEPLPTMDRARRWERVPVEEVWQPEPTTPPEPEPEPHDVPRPSDGPFDPAEHTVLQVLEYLAEAGPRERGRVLQAEAEGRGRRGVLNSQYADRPED